MTQSANTGRTTRASQVIKASREAIYQAFLDPVALAEWLPPDGMRGEVHTLEPYVGGKFRLSLTYLNPADSLPGKSSEDTDTVAGTFAELIPNQKIVWVTEFESDQPEFAGEMRIIWRFADADGGTEVTALCENVPVGIRLEDNELGTRLSLRKLAGYVES